MCPWVYLHVRTLYVHTYVHTYIHTYIHTHIHTYVHTCTCKYVPPTYGYMAWNCTHVCVCVYVCIYIYIYICLSLSLSARLPPPGYMSAALLILDCLISGFLQDIGFQISRFARLKFPEIPDSRFPDLHALSFQIPDFQESGIWKPGPFDSAHNSGIWKLTACKSGEIESPETCACKSGNLESGILGLVNLEIKHLES